MKLLFIPNWNGHLYLSENKETSVKKVFDNVNFENKEFVEIEKNNIKNTNNIIENKFLEQKERVLSITGDHSNTYSLFKAFAKNKENSKLIVFDAHPDVEISTDSVSHEDYIRCLIEDKICLAENIYLFGIRTFSRVEFDYLQEKGINYFSIIDILKDKDKDKIKNILTSITGEIYLSIDIDVLDPDCAPGTYYKEWCGLNFDELLLFINIIKNNVGAVDICEYLQEKDEDEITLNNVLKLIDNFVVNNIYK